MPNPKTPCRDQRPRKPDYRTSCQTDLSIIGFRNSEMNVPKTVPKILLVHHIVIRYFADVLNRQVATMGNPANIIYIGLVVNEIPKCSLEPVHHPTNRRVESLNIDSVVFRFSVTDDHAWKWPENEQDSEDRDHNNYYAENCRSIDDPEAVIQRLYLG